MARVTADTAAKTTPNPDANTARELLLWLRKERIVVGALQVGAVRIEAVQDLALRRSEAGEPKPASARRTSMYERYGGGLVPTSAPPGSPAQAESAVTEQDDDDQ